MKRIGLVFMVMVLACTVWVSCGKTEEEKKADATQEYIDYAKLYRESSVNDLLKGNWQREEIEKSDSLMVNADFHSNVFESHYRMSSPHFSVGRDKFYRLEGFFVDENNWGDVLDILDPNIMEKTVIEYRTLPGGIWDLCVSAEQMWGYIEKEDDDGYIEKLLVVQLFEDGTCSEAVDITVALESGDIWQQDAYYASGVDYIYEASSGNHYILPDNGASLSRMDAEGQLIGFWRGFSENRSTIEFLCQTYDGTCLFRSKDSITGDTKIFYFKDNEPVVLMEEGDLLCLDMLADSHGNLIYRGSDNSLVEWNPVTGTQTKLYSGSIDTYEFLVGIVRNEAGDILILNDEYELTKLAFTNQNEEITITLQAYPFASYDLKQAAKRYEQMHSNVHVEILERAFGIDKVDTEFGKIYTEISEGGGPDIIQLDREYMKYFNEKGCLLDFTGAIPTEITENLYEGILEAGMVQGKQVMLPYQFDIYALLVKDEVWSKDSWTISEFIEVLENLEQEGAEIENLQITSWGDYVNPFSTVIQDIAHSDFLDMEMGTCSFDSLEFVHLLEVCKRYYDSSGGQVSQRMADKKFAEGTILTRSSYYMNFYHFSSEMKLFSEDSHLVGYPTNTGNGNFLYCRTGFAINKNTEHAEEIIDFYKYLYTYDRVKDSSTANGHSNMEVRKDYYDGRILNGEDMNWSDTPRIRESGHVYSGIDGKPDGTTFIEEYQAFRDSLAIYEDEYDFIKTILWDEVDPYFEGNLSAETVARTIQSRVQLYLDEQ